MAATKEGEATIAKAELEVIELLEKIPEDYRGLLFKRVLKLSGHPVTRKLEQAFALEWAEVNGESIYRPILLSLLSQSYEDHSYDPDPRDASRPQTRREWEVAHLATATFAQWLGTPSGLLFLRKALKRAGGDLNVTLPKDED